jgi:hypothetical protein
MAGSEIGLDDGRIARNFGIGAIGQNLAALHHCDPVAKIGDHGEVMFDHQHRAIDRDAADEVDDAADILVTHP